MSVAPDGIDLHPDARTVYDVFAATAARRPDNPLLAVPRRLAEDWELPATDYSYGAVLTEVTRLRDLYAEAGYGHGHRIAVLLENRPALYIHWLALNALGVSLVPINPDYRSEETRYLLDHSEAALVVALPHRVEDLRAIAATSERTPPVIDVTRIEADLPKAARPATRRAPGPDDEAALLYTSGTTGRPKGCILSNAYFHGWGRRYVGIGGRVSLRPGQERLLQPLPTFHVNAIGNAFQGMLFSGGCQIVLDRFHPKIWWREAAETRATIFHYLGVMPAMLLGLPPSEDDRRHGLRLGFGGGVEPAHHAAFEARFGCVLTDGWAMTEAGGIGLMSACDEPRRIGRRCMGKPPPELEIRLVDGDGREISGEGQGEMLIRAKGPDPRRGFFSGYLKDEAATEAAWDGGWFHTGDVVRRDAEGYLYFGERKKSIIRRSGENIAPAEIELVLYQSPLVRNVAVIAAADPVRGEEVMACVEPAEGVAASAETADALFDWCFERLAYYKAPGYIAFFQQLPTTSTQKVQKAGLAALGRDPMSGANVFDVRERKRRGPSP
ncbi:MAG TPA: AMP-binding protein [Alphaproteobacteria bacterium]